MSFENNNYLIQINDVKLKDIKLKDIRDNEKVEVTSNVEHNIKVKEKNNCIDIFFLCCCCCFSLN